MRDYFFYAIEGNLQNASQVGTCDPDCPYYKDTCCVRVKTRIDGNSTVFDNICLNKYVAQSSFSVQLAGMNFTLRCSLNSI